MQNITQNITATLVFASTEGDGIDMLRDRHGWTFVPDRVDVDFQVSRATNASWMPFVLDISGTVFRKDGGESTVRRHRIWTWNTTTATFTDATGHPAPQWAVRWAQAVCPVNDVPLDPDRMLRP